MKIRLALQMLRAFPSRFRILPFLQNLFTSRRHDPIKTLAANRRSKYAKPAYATGIQQVLRLLLGKLDQFKFFFACPFALNFSSVLCQLTKNGVACLNCHATAAAIFSSSLYPLPFFCLSVHGCRYGHSHPQIAC